MSAARRFWLFYTRLLLEEEAAQAVVTSSHPQAAGAEGMVTAKMVEDLQKEARTWRDARTHRRHCLRQGQLEAEE